MTTTWNEIHQRAVAFVRRWQGETSERAEAQTFWNEFFAIFGLDRRAVGRFEQPVQALHGKGFKRIDLFWPGKLIVEHKSAGQSLDKAASQANGYVLGLIDQGEREGLPEYLIVSDFQRIALHHLGNDEASQVFHLTDLPDKIKHFGFMAGFEKVDLSPQDPVNIRAAEIMAQVHDALEQRGYPRHQSGLFLTRLLFCLFAEDSNIFEPMAFSGFLENYTRADGSDVGPRLTEFFQVLNTPPEQRQQGLEEELARLPYVNGSLFQGDLLMPKFDTALRQAVIKAGRLDWSKISPAIFGSLFQAVMEPAERRQMGAHYTSEQDIMKVVQGLFLDELQAEFEQIKNDRRRLTQFHHRLGRLKLLDPACGCGNFLLIAYRELRRLETKVILAMHPKKFTSVTDIGAFCLVQPSQFYGFELLPFPAEIARVTLWLMDHLMNQELSAQLGMAYQRLPLSASPNILEGNALQLEWNGLLPAKECFVILGNPPFTGAKYMTAQQRAEMKAVCAAVENHGLLDYVAGWYVKAAQYMKRNPAVRCAFVSTNSLSQGEQVGVLWKHLLHQGAKIHFAHRTFAWQSEARGKAHVHVVIIGWGLMPVDRPRLFDYATGTGEAQVHETNPANISPYLTAGPPVLVLGRSTPLCKTPALGIGNKPIDGGFYLFTPGEKKVFLKQQPEAEPWFRRWLGSREFIHNEERWCLWLGDCPPEKLQDMTECLKRVESVRQYREKSVSQGTRALAHKPTRFHVENMPDSPFLVIPSVSSERRRYIPMGFMQPDVLVSNLCLILPHATPWHFGVLTSAMHMAWVRHIGGRLKSDFRYSANLLYNNFPWPDADAKKQQVVEKAAQAVLEERARHPGASLAVLYDPLTMPPALVDAHHALDLAVDRCYRKAPFTGDADRLAFLLDRYQTLTSPLVPEPVSAKKKVKRREK